MLYVDCAFPGGNIVVDRIDGDAIHVRPDVTLHQGWWFYFNFRVWNAAGRRLKVVFGDTDNPAPLTWKGPCVRYDDGPFAWAGGAEDCRSFELNVPHGTQVVQCALAFPYVEEDFLRFASARPALAVRAIGSSNGGRPVLCASVHAKRRKHAFILMARSHACESMASFVLEGAMDAWLGATGELANARRDAIDLHVVPFIDPDGVELGMQGKNRSPHDHNRDWRDNPIYASIRSLQQWLTHHVDAQTVIFDVHCPWIRNDRNDTLFFCGVHEPMASELRALQSYLPRKAGDALPYEPADDIPMGVDWHTGIDPTSSKWIREHTAARLMTTMEVPYALARDTIVTPDRCRAFGGRLADAATRYFG